MFHNIQKAEQEILCKPFYLPLCAAVIHVIYQFNGLYNLITIFAEIHLMHILCVQWGKQQNAFPRAHQPPQQIKRIWMQFLFCPSFEWTKKEERQNSNNWMMHSNGGWRKKRNVNIELNRKMLYELELNHFIHDEFEMLLTKSGHFHLTTSGEYK